MHHYMYIYKYRYIYVCVCVCMCVCVCVELQILEALYNRMKQPKLNRINFVSSTNILKCL